MRTNIKIIFKFWLLILAFYVFADSPQDIFSFSVMVLKQDKEIELDDLFSKLRISSKTPIMIISNIDVSNDTLYLKTGKYQVEDILKAFCEKFKAHKYYVKDNKIIIRQKSLISNQAFQDALQRKLILPNPDKIKLWKLPDEFPEPVGQWLIPEDQITEDMRKAIEDYEKTLKENYPAIKREHMSLVKFYVSMKMQRFCFCFHGKEGEWNVDVEKYKNIQLSKIFEDIISSNSYWCWIHEFSDSTKDSILKENSEGVKFLKEEGKEAEIDEGMLELLKPGPIYGIEIYSPNYNPENFDEEKEEASAKPEQESLLLSDVPVSLDGKKLLKVNSVFSEKKNSLTVTIENISAEKLSFRDLKDDFMIMELYDDERKDTFERTIFASEKTELPASFRLAPGESKIFEFKFNGARFKEKYGHPFLIKEAGTENQLRLDKVPFKELRDLGVRIETFYPIIYFELNGKRYKSSGEEAVMQE